jgi:hypothetical protein
MGAAVSSLDTRPTRNGRRARGFRLGRRSGHEERGGVGGHQNDARDCHRVGEAVSAWYD